MRETQLPMWLRLLVVGVLVWAFTLLAVNLMPAAWRERLPAFVPQQVMTLGLDLQGGAHLVMQVSREDVLVRAYEGLEDEVRELARTDALRFSGLQTSASGVILTLLDEAQVAMLREKLAQERVQLDAVGKAVTLTYAENYLSDLQARALDQTLTVLRSRVDQFGVAEPLIQRQGSDRVIVELPGVRDVARAKAAIGKTAQLTFHLVDERASGGIVPPGKMLLQDENGQPLLVTKRPSLTGELLTSAAAAFDQFGTPAVDIAFNSRGTQLFAKLSTENVGKRFAIVLDGKVYSAPVFREPILGGRAQISGAFKVEEAQDLAAVLNAGALPARVSVVEERTIGPSLGADSITAGVVAMALGIALIVVFMTLFYGLFGVMACIALMCNLALLIALMASFGFTLTLPGLAGIVLTLGMAVDSNVLIFERVREEVARGQKPLNSLLNGFSGAFRTILDGNVTTLVAAVVLFVMGTGPIKGFSVTLTIGLLVSMFTSVTLTRWMMLGWYRWTRPKALPL